MARLPHPSLRGARLDAERGYASQGESMRRLAPGKRRARPPVDRIDNAARLASVLSRLNGRTR
jgi:hypothetical protein